MDVKVRFKDRIFKNASSVDDIRERIEKRNPDIIVLEAFDVESEFAEASRKFKKMKERKKEAEK